MMIRPLLVLALLCRVVAAEPSPSPRLAALAAKPATQDAFWKQVATEGTPLVEDIKDPKGRLLVSFLYRAKPGTKHVAMYNAPNGTLFGYQQLARIPKTDTFAWSTLVAPDARFTYFLAPGDNFGPLVGMPNFEKRQPLWIPDPTNKRPYLVSGSMLELPKAPVQSWLVPKRGTPAGDLVAFTAKSKALSNERTVLVYTPPGFAKTGARYPLVVMFDGTTTLERLLVTITLDELIAAKKIPPVVALLVDNADRGKELPGNPAFADFVAHDLVPWVRRDYHATSDPRLTVVAGISYGGIAATFAATRHPAVYGNVLSQSGSYWWGADDADPEAHARELAGRPRLPLRFWMECGTLETGSPKPISDQLGANRHMRDVLTARGYQMSYREFTGAHEYVHWRGSIADGLIALLATPPRFTDKAPASPGKAGGLEVGALGGKTKVGWKAIALATRTALLDGGAAAVTQLKTIADADEPTVNAAGYVLLGVERAKDAIPIFALNTERFPKSGNAHDSLGEAYYVAGDRKNALASYKRSLALDPKNTNAKKMIAFLNQL
jgi:enterochelin esterase family protein